MRSRLTKHRNGRGPFPGLRNVYGSLSCPEDDLRGRPRGRVPIPSATSFRGSRYWSRDSLPSTWQGQIQAGTCGGRRIASPRRGQVPPASGPEYERILSSVDARETVRRSPRFKCNSHLAQRRPAAWPPAHPSRHRQKPPSRSPLAARGEAPESFSLASPSSPLLHRSGPALQPAGAFPNHGGPELRLIRGGGGSRGSTGFRNAG